MIDICPECGKSLSLWKDAMVCIDCGTGYELEYDEV